MKKSCELCKGTARIRCESDQASLCWDCDAKVHSANFLVARHSRNLLCRRCQSPTAWSAAGSKLEHTYSDCRKCAAGTACDEENEEKPVKEEAAEIPWSPPPPPESSLSGGEAFHGGEAAVVRKRGRLPDNGRPTLDDLNLCTPPSDTAVEVASVVESISKAKPLRKIRRTDGLEFEVRASKSPIAETMRRFRREEVVAGKEMPENRTMSGGAGAIDLNLTLTLSR